MGVALLAAPEPFQFPGEAGIEPKRLFQRSGASVVNSQEFAGVTHHP